MKTPLSPQKILDFVARRQAHKSLQATAIAAGVLPGNVRSGLGGIRTLPQETLRRLAAACGLQLQTEPALHLSLMPDTVIHLELALEDLDKDTLPVFRDVMAALIGPVHWRLIVAAGINEPSAGAGCYMVAVAHRQVHYEGAYIAVHIKSPTWKAAETLIEQPTKLAKALGSQQAVIAARWPTGDARWIRLQSGLLSVRELDVVLQLDAEPAPTGEDWGELLAATSRAGLAPMEVIRHLSLIRAQYD